MTASMGKPRKSAIDSNVYYVNSSNCNLITYLECGDVSARKHKGQEEEHTQQEHQRRHNVLGRNVPPPVVQSRHQTLRDHHRQEQPPHETKDTWHSTGNQHNRNSAQQFSSVMNFEKIANKSAVKLFKTMHTSHHIINSDKTVQ
jgi:hypothetical protein